MEENVSETETLDAVVESINDLTTAIQDQIDQSVANEEKKLSEEESAAVEEKNTNELLEEIKTSLEVREPTEEELEQSSIAAEKQANHEEFIEQQLVSLNESLLVLREEMPNKDLVAEGYFFSGLSVVIAFAVYMFWNQLSKW